MPQEFMQLVSVLAILIGIVGIFKAFTAAHSFFKNIQDGRPSEGTEWAQFADAALFVVIGFSSFITGVLGLIPTL